MTVWKTIDSAPKDGTWFVIAIPFGRTTTYEVGRYDPSYFPKYVEVGDGLYRREEEEIYAWSGFSNMHAAKYWSPIDPPPPDNTDV